MGKSDNMIIFCPNEKIEYIILGTLYCVRWRKQHKRRYNRPSLENTYC